jgi:hypothetical protein
LRAAHSAAYNLHVTEAERKVVWIIVVMAACFFFIFAVLARVPAHWFNRFFE